MRPQRVLTLKRIMRESILAHDRALSNLDCGANLAAVISPDVLKFARRANSIARELAQVDPQFPKDWIPLPEGT